jgi:glycine cleavage system transcriptional repressor
MKQAIISVLLPDRVGILRDVTRVVFDQGGNIVVIRQTIVHGFFSLVFTVVFERTADPAALSAALKGALDADAAVTVRPFARQPPMPLPAGSTYIVTTHGPDRPGTVYGISQFLVDRGINIIDWMVEGEQDDVVYIAEVVLPPEADFRQVQIDFRAEMARRGLRASICHQNIFRATSEIGAIHNLLSGN